jgi:multidrug efflux pump subunit AcrA (membrane-fusion protein)
LAGQFARVRAPIETIHDALLIPQRSVSELPGIFRVYVVGAEGSVELREVVLGPKVDQLQVVRSGLEPGERVALEIMRLGPGMTVEPTHVALDARGAVQDVAAPRAPDTEADAERARAGDAGA